MTTKTEQKRMQKLMGKYGKSGDFSGKAYSDFVSIHESKQTETAEAMYLIKKMFGCYDWQGTISNFTYTSGLANVANEWMRSQPEDSHWHTKRIVEFAYDDLTSDYRIKSF